MAGCATPESSKKISDFKFCERNICSTVTDSASQTELLSKIFQLLKQNENKDVELFEADPSTKIEKVKGINILVMGGPIKEFAKGTSVRFTQVSSMDKENLLIKCTVLPNFTFLKIKTVYLPGDGVFSIKGNDIQLNFSNVGSWMVVGTAIWGTKWLIDFIDFDKKIFGAYYEIGGGGPTRWGGGEGYMYVKFQ
jgi:hypothetical protein